MTMVQDSGQDCDKYRFIYPANSPKCLHLLSMVLTDKSRNAPGRDISSLHFVKLNMASSVNKREQIKQ